MTARNKKQEETALEKRHRLELTNYVINKVAEILGITVDEYRKLVFEAGIKVLSKSKLKTEASRNRLYWDHFIHRKKFIDLQLIIEQDFYKQTAEFGGGTIDKYLYSEIISAEFDLPSRVLKSINSQYRLQFGESEKTVLIDLTPQKRNSTKRVSKGKKNQIEINLNTI